MSQRRPPRPLPHQPGLSDFPSVEPGRGPLHLRGPRGQILVEVLQDDVLRLRATSRAGFKAYDSGAIAAPLAPTPVGALTHHGRFTALSTSNGSFRIDRTRGTWELVDRNGLSIAATSEPMLAMEGRTEVRLRLAEREAIFGLGEGTGPLNRRGLVRDFWNIDVLGHAPAIHSGLQSLYVSIPFGLSLRDGRAAGWFWDFPGRQSWDLGQTHRSEAHLSSESPEIDLYLFLGPTVSGVVERFTELTGRIPLPPRWALGYQQCRYSYETRAELESVAREFRRRQLPCDVLYLDIHHQDGHRVFTFGKDYPRPREMLAGLLRKGFKTVAIVNPGVKDEPSFGVLRRGKKVDGFVKTADGASDVVGKVWPGRSRFPDFLHGRTRDWWGAEQRRLMELGVSGIWNDMNEPANFARPDKTLPPDAVHRTDQGPRAHAEVHNLYGQEMARASREGWLTHGHRSKRGSKSKGPTTVPRPFVVSRAGYAGIQRHALVWTGDNSSSWEHLRDTLPTLLNLSLSGVALCGADVGGFLGTPTPELFLRWFQCAAFTPFFRNHSNHGTPAQEPWAFGEPTEELCRLYLQLRYQLIPFFYALTAQARATGAPWMRPLLWDFANDPIAAACEDQFMVGSQLLVAPVLQPGATARCVYLPNDLWYDFWTGTVHPGGRHIIAQAPLEQIPLFVRAGSLLPMEAVASHVKSTAPDTLSLHCWPRGRGTLEWYEDDGATQAYPLGAFCRRTIHSRTRGRTLELHFEPEMGSWSSTVNTWRLILWSARSAKALTVNGVPFGGSFDADGGVCIAEIPNSPGELQVRFSGLSA